MVIADAVDDDDDSSNGSESQKKSETVVVPWVGYNEQEAMKAQILALSKVLTCFLTFLHVYFPLSFPF